MTGKYQQLAAHLAALPEDQPTEEMTFEQVDRIVGGLPPSARTLRQWWANSSHGQALAWREAGWHVETVEFATGRVRFDRGRVGGTRADRLATTRVASSVTAPAAPVVVTAPASAPEGETVTAQVSQEVSVSVRFSWQQLGAVTLDADGKVSFPRPLPQAPGLYRMHFTSDGSSQLDRFYIGETDNLRRRLASNYRNPGPRQRTSLRVNEALRTHLVAGGGVTLAITPPADLYAQDGDSEPLDLTRKAGRLLAESAALVLAQRAGLQLENLG